MKKNTWIKDIIWYVSMFAIILLLRIFIFGSVSVSGQSMYPTLVDHERLITLKQTKVERFDIVTFPPPNNPKENYIKRVIGLPGDTIEYRNDQLLINGKVYEEPHLTEGKKNVKEELGPDILLTEDFTLKSVTGVEKVPEGKIFVMGDNRRNSLDSREIGFIDKDQVSGDVWFSFWPPSKMGSVK